MMYTQLWRKWDPINIPVSSKQIDVIGFKKQNRLEDEDFDSDFDEKTQEVSQSTLQRKRRKRNQEPYAHLARIHALQ